MARLRFVSHRKMKLKWSEVYNSSDLYTFVYRGPICIFDLGFLKQKKDKTKRISSMRKESKSKLLKTRLKI